MNVKYLKSLNPFELERLRDNLAKGGRLDLLKITYNLDLPEITNNNTPELWDDLNISTNEIVNKNNPMVADRLKIVSSHIREDNVKVLNVGFGSANLEKLFFSKYHSPDKNISWTGIDFSPMSVAIATERFANTSNLHFKEGNVLYLQEEINSFNYVIALEVLEHINQSNTFRAYEEMYKVLKPYGYLILSVPQNEGLEKMIGKKNNPNAHVRVYTPPLLRAELQLAKFTILQEKRIFAFSQLYRLKTLICNYLLKSYRKTNNIIILAQKGGETDKDTVVAKAPHAKSHLKIK